MESVDPRPPKSVLEKPPGGGRLRLYEVIFESDTHAGRLFDQVLIGVILLSVAVVMADSVESINCQHGRALALAEWLFTALFTLEYLARLLCLRNPLRYATSFFGVIDLLALLPTYLALFIPDLHTLIDVCVPRLLRVFPRPTSAFHCGAELSSSPGSSAAPYNAH